ncbi:MAG: hypothetical protein ACPGTO_10035 [Polaribacter sp.]
MKKIILIVFTVFLNVALTSCSQGEIIEDLEEIQACCGEDEPILPPPPPPPPPTGGN